MLSRAKIKLHAGEGRCCTVHTIWDHYYAARRCGCSSERRAAARRARNCRTALGATSARIGQCAAGLRRTARARSRAAARSRLGSRAAGAATRAGRRAVRLRAGRGGAPCAAAAVPPGSSAGQCADGTGARASPESRADARVSRTGALGRGARCECRAPAERPRRRRVVGRPEGVRRRRTGGDPRPGHVAALGAAALPGRVARA